MCLAHKIQASWSWCTERQFGKPLVLIQTRVIAAITRSTSALPTPRTVRAEARSGAPAALERLLDMFTSTKKYLDLNAPEAAQNISFVDRNRQKIAMQCGGVD